MSSLFEAAKQSDGIKALQHHLYYGADINQRDNESFTALMHAAAMGHADCAELLVRRKANLEFTNQRGDTALTIASDNGDIQVVQVLLDGGADINHGAFETITPIMMAAYSNKAKIAELLLKRGADLSPVHGMTAMEIAKSRDYRELVAMFESCKSVTWSPDTHGYFVGRFKSSVGAVLMLHRTEPCSTDAQQQVVPCHRDCSNRFWKLPKPLLFRILAFSAPPARVVST